MSIDRVFIPKADTGSPEKLIEKIVLKNTKDFQKAIESGDIQQAEEFLSDVKNNREKYPNYDDRWIDHRERELFKAYRTKAGAAQDEEEKDRLFNCANDIIENMTASEHSGNVKSRQGRIDVLSNEM